MSDNKIINALLVVAVVINLVLGTMIGYKMGVTKNTQKTPAANQVKSAITEWIDQSTLKLEASARQTNADVTAYLPTADEKRAAVDSGSIDSDPFRRVKEKLRGGYRQLNLPFPDI